MIRLFKCEFKKYSADLSRTIIAPGCEFGSGALTLSKHGSKIVIPVELVNL